MKSIQSIVFTLDNGHCSDFLRERNDLGLVSFLFLIFTHCIAVYADHRLLNLSRYRTLQYTTKPNLNPCPIGFTETMKCPLLSGGSGSSSYSKRIVLHLSGSGVRKSSARRKKSRISIQTTTEKKSLRQQEKWQAFFDSARDVSTDTETVRVLLISALEEEHSQEKENKSSQMNFSEYPEYDSKGLMTQIYQDLHNVATAQALKTGNQEVSKERDFIGEIGDIDELLQKVSVGVSSAISKFFAFPICITLLIRLQDQHLPICKNPRGGNPLRVVIVTKRQSNTSHASIQPTSGTVNWPLITAGSFSANWLTPPLSARQLTASTHPNGKPSPPSSTKIS